MLYYKFGAKEKLLENKKDWLHQVQSIRHCTIYAESILKGKIWQTLSELDYKAAKLCYNYDATVAPPGG